MIGDLIRELVNYGLDKNLIDKADEIYAINRLLELFNQDEYKTESDNADGETTTDKIIANKTANDTQGKSYRSLEFILEDMLNFAYENGIIKSDTITEKDLFDTRIMSCITPAPSVVRQKFHESYKESPEAATDFYYDFSVATNYIRADRIKKDQKWVTESEYGDIDITINLSKPEKDPRDIAKAGKAKKSGYPLCLLCKENEGYAGHFNHPARQNHRVIDLKLGGENYYLQYSPYVYYNQHCIIFNEEHIPMKIDRAVFRKLLDFVEQFPHYIAGSNADLPIVGGSILSHDHFQGGRYDFPMAKAGIDREIEIKGFPTVKAGIVKWPMSVIRLNSKDKESVVNASEKILNSWRGYTDEKAYIFSETDGEKHNTITPIARMRDGNYEIDLVLRNNITTKERPMGLYHPSPELHHIKKENIGLIEVMGLAVLPARLKKEMDELAEAILNHKDIRGSENIEKHADWVEEWINAYEINENNIYDILHKEIGKVFVKVLECAGVYKRDEKGQEYFDRFVNQLNH